MFLDRAKKFFRKDRPNVYLRYSGILGKTNDASSCKDKSKANHVYVRVGNKGQVVSVFNKRVEPYAGLPVTLGYCEAQPDLFQVLGVRVIHLPTLHALPLPHLKQEEVCVHINGVDSSIKAVNANEATLFQVPEKGDKAVISYTCS